MQRLLKTLRPILLFTTIAALLPVSASAATDSKPTPPASGHDVTRPWVMEQAASDLAAAPVKPQQPRGAVAPLKPRGGTAASAAAASPALSREVFGFAKADSLADPAVGFRTWNFALLSDVAYFGVHVNPDGTLVQNDSGWAVWQSSTASDLINTAHAAGVRVLLTLMMLPAASQNATLCSAIDNRQTTLDQVAAQMKGADGIDLDYEGTNQTCPDGVSLRTKVVQLAQAFRARNLGRLVIDTYASSAVDGGGFFDIPGLAGSVDRFFVMAYGLESSNGPCALCMGPTSPFDGAAPNYTWNVTRAANSYATWKAQSILGLPYYGVAGCVQGPNPPANASVLSPSKYSASPYTVMSTIGSNPSISSLQQQRDALDPGGQEPWATYFHSDPSLNCWREAYWDDAISLTHKYDLVNQRGFAGAGIFTLDYGGGSPELWNLLALEFGPGQGFQSLGGGAVTSSPAVTSWGTSRLDLFARGPDNSLLHRWWTGGGWSGWESLGGVLASAPAAVSWGPGRIDVFVRGTDDAVWHKWYAGGWSGWESLGGVINEAPAVSAWSPGRLDVFARGAGNSMYHRWYAGGWSVWEGLGGFLSSGPAAVSWSANRIDVFVRGGEGAVWHRWYDSGWSGWENQGGTSKSIALAPASTAPGLLDVYGMATDGSLVHETWNGSGWSGWVAAPGGAGPWQFAPAAVAQPRLGHVDVFVVAGDGSISHSEI